MDSYPAITPRRMRSINQTAIFEFIRMRGQASRAVIASELDLSLPSVVRIVDSLLERGYLRFSGQYEDSGGRKRPLLELNNEKNLFLGISITPVRIRACLMDFLGGALNTREVPFYLGDTKKSLNALCSLVAKMTPQSGGVSDVYFRGISIAVPGIVNNKTGDVLVSHALQWKDVPLKSLVVGKFNVPVVVENDATLGTLGEMRYGFGRKCFNMAVLVVNMGIGSGIVMDGTIYRGSNNSAGEIGNLVFKRDRFKALGSETGPLEYDAAGIGLVRKVRALKNIDVPADDMDVLRLLFDKYREGKKWAQPIIEEFYDNLAMAVEAIASVTDPELIVLHGFIVDMADDIVEKIRGRFNGAYDASRCPIEVSEINDRAELVGGIVAQIYETLDFCCFRSLS